MTHHLHISEIRSFLSDQEDPIYFVGPTPFNLPA